MVFSSATFLFLFLPLVIASYYAMPYFLRNFWLLLASIFFYAWGSVDFMWVLGGAIVVDYLIGFFLNSQKWGKVFFIFGILFNVGLLAYFKYANFFVDQLGMAFGLDPAGWIRVLLPLGISFFTFHKISYLSDIYRGNNKHEKNFINYALYILLFPQLIAGPIIRYSQINEQINAREHGFEKFFEGVWTFILGLSMKVLIADPVGKIHQDVFSGVHVGEVGSLALLLGLLAFSFQIYFDFAGYSRMAIGLGRMFGFEFPENFNRPYLSRSITEFWRRWHMTLSGFFKEYIYIPLGGNKEGELKMIRNLFLVFLLTGIWHGAGWNFIVWGVYFGILVIFEKIWLGSWLARIPGWVAQFFTFFLVFFGWILFQAGSLNEAVEVIRGLFAFNGGDLAFTSMNMRNMLALVVAGILSFVAFDYKRLVAFGEKDGVRVALIVFLLVNCFLAVAGDSYHPFLYFNF